MPVCAIDAAAPTASSRFFGLTPASNAASPNAAGGLILSIVFIQLGSAASSPSLGRARNCLTQTASSSRPRTILTQLTHVAGEPDELAPAGPDTDRTIAPTTASPASQPMTKAAPLTRGWAW